MYFICSYYFYNLSIPLKICCDVVMVNVFREVADGSKPGLRFSFYYFRFRNVVKVTKSLNHDRQTHTKVREWLLFQATLELTVSMHMFVHFYAHINAYINTFWESFLIPYVWKIFSHIEFIDSEKLKGYYVQRMRKPLISLLSLSTSFALSLSLFQKSVIESKTQWPPLPSSRAMFVQRDFAGFLVAPVLLLLSLQQFCWLHA